MTHYIDGLHMRKVVHSLNGLRLAHVTPARVESCLNQLAQENRLSDTTRNHYLKLLRTMSRWTVARGYLLDDFTRGIPVLRTVTKPRQWLSKLQREKFLELAEGSRYFPMVATALFAGLRWSELVNLRWENVDFQENVLHIQPTDVWSPKSKRGRLIPLHPRLRAVLEPLQAKDGVCFPAPVDRGGRPYRERAYPKSFKLWFQEVGLSGKRLGWHTLRHTFASLLVQEGVSVYKVCQWLGHSEVKTTQIYAHLIPAYDEDISRV